MEFRGEKNFGEAQRGALCVQFRSLSLDGCFGVSLTMKQWSDGVRLDEIRASQNLRHFLNRVNRAVFGTRFKRFGVRLRVIPVLEKSSSGRLHYHLVLQNPFPDSPARFERLIEEEWGKTQFGYSQTHVHPQIDHGWTDYISKTKTASDGPDWENYHWS